MQGLQWAGWGEEGLPGSSHGVRSTVSTGRLFALSLWVGNPVVVLESLVLWPVLTMFCRRGGGTACGPLLWAFH